MTDAATGKPIQGARVADDGYGPQPRKGDTTDTAGRFHFTTWGEEHNVTATAAGYKPVLKLVRDTSERELTLNFALTRP